MTQPAAASPIHVETVQLSLLAPDPDQIRKHFDEDALQSLADSIKANGLIQPIVVRPCAAGEGTYAGVRDVDYRIVAGERRYRAARLAGIQNVPVIVREDLAGADITVMQVLENLQREDLSLAETCVGVNKLITQIGFAKTCRQLGKSEAWVSKHASVVKLPGELVALVHSGQIQSVDIAQELALLAKLDADEYDKFLKRYNREEPELAVDLAAQPEPTTLEAAEAQEDVARVQHQFELPTRAEIRSAIAEIRAERLDRERREQDAARIEAARHQSADADQEDGEEDDDAPSGQPSPSRPGLTEQDRQRNARTVLAERVNKEAAKFAGERCLQLAQILGGRKLIDPDTGYRISIDNHYVTHWDEGPLPSDALTAQYNINVSGPVDQVTPAFHALGLHDHIRADLHELTVSQAVAIFKLLGRSFSIYRNTRTSGDALFKTLNAAAARNAPPKPSGKASAKGKAKPGAKGKQSAVTDPHGIAAFLAECVQKSRVPGRRLQPSVLYLAYEKWCKAQKRVPIPIKHNGWGKGIADAGIEKVRSNGFWYVDIELVKA